MVLTSVNLINFCFIYELYITSKMVAARHKILRCAVVSYEISHSTVERQSDNWLEDHSWGPVS